MSNAVRAIYLSPHHDDVCFSLGALARKLGGVLINVFTVSSYTAALPYSSDPVVVSRIRDEEDRKFALNCGLTRYNLNQLDSPLRGRDPFDPTDLSAEVELLRPILRHLISRLAYASQRLLLFCPAGIGMHRDHLIVRGAALAENSQKYQMVFYEELHYAADKVQRERGLRDFLVATGQFNYSIRYKFGVSPEKLQLVQTYASQFDKLPNDLAAFIPADGSNIPHEAAWANQPITIFKSVGYLLRDMPKETIR